jgi:hypothetical protein
MGNSFVPVIGVGVGVPLEALPRRADGRPTDDEAEDATAEHADWVTDSDLYHLAEHGVDLGALRAIWAATQPPAAPAAPASRVRIVLGRAALVNTYKYDNMEPQCFTVYFLSALWDGDAGTGRPTRASAALQEVRTAMDIDQAATAFFARLTEAFGGGAQAPRLVAFIGGYEGTL